MRFFVITCHSVFNVWPKTTLLPMWPRDTNRLDTPGLGDHSMALCGFTPLPSRSGTGLMGKAGGGKHIGNTSQNGTRKVLDLRGTSV